MIEKLTKVNNQYLIKEINDYRNLNKESRVNNNIEIEYNHI